MSKELTVVLKDSERTYRQKFLTYSDFCLIEEDPIIKECVSEARKNFDGEPEDIQIRVLMVIK